MEHLLVATFKSIKDELLAKTIETGAIIVLTYIPGVSENTLCLPYDKYLQSEGYKENDDSAKGFVIKNWSGKSSEPEYTRNLEVLYRDVNFRFKSTFTTDDHCSITPDLGNTLLLGSNYGATVEVDNNYVLKSVIVKVGGQIVQTGNNARIDLNNILGDIEIIAKTEQNTYTITYRFDPNCVESSNTRTEITHGETYVTTLSSKEGYATLGAGNVTVGGVIKYSWEAGDPEVAIRLENVDGNIEVYAECGSKDDPVSKYQVEVKYVTGESGQYVSIDGPNSDYTLEGEYDEGARITSSAQNINTNGTDDYDFSKFDPEELIVSASSKTIYVVYIPKGNHTITYDNISINGCVSSSNTNTSVQDGDTYTTTLTLDTNNYTSATVTITRSDSLEIILEINLDANTPEKNVEFIVTENIDITATCGDVKKYTVTYNHIAGLSSSTGQQIVSSIDDSVIYGTTITISNLDDNIRLSEQELNDRGYGTYINNSGYGYNNNSVGQETALTSNFTVTENTTIYLYYSETSQGTVVFNYYIDDNNIPISSLTITKDVETSVTLNDYKDLPPDVLNPEYYDFDSFYPNVPSIIVNNTTQVVNVYYITKLFNVNYNYVDNTSGRILKNTSDKVDCGTVININEYILDIENYNYTNQYRTFPETAQNNLITITENTAITYFYDSTEEPCQSTCDLDYVEIQTVPNGYQILSTLTSPDGIIEKLSKLISIIYKTSLMENEELATVSSLGWTIVIPDNITVSDTPYTGQVIDCECNSHDFTFYYGDYDPYIEVLVDGCYNLNDGLTPRENIHYRVITNSTSYDVSTQISDDEKFVSITVDTGERTHTTEIPICPHFKVTVIQGTYAEVSTEHGAYPWYGDESNFTITSSEPGKIIERVTLIVKDHDTGAYLYKLDFGPITRLSEYSGNYEVMLDYGTVNHLGTTQTSEAFEVTINETGDSWDVNFVNIKGDLNIEVQYLSGCLKQVVYRHCTKINGNIVPIEGIPDSTYWVYKYVSGSRIDENVVTSLSEYEDYVYEDMYITGTNTSQSTTSCEDNQQYDLVYMPSCTITLICMFNGDILCTSETKTSDPPTRIILPNYGDSNCPGSIYVNYKIDTATSSKDRTLEIDDTKKIIYASTDHATTFECGEIVTANLIEDDEAKLLCYFNTNPRIIINRLPERGEEISIGLNGHYYVKADRYSLYDDGNLVSEDPEVLSLTFAGDFDEDKGFVIENATTQLFTADVDTLTCSVLKCYKFSNSSDGKFIIPYEGEGTYTEENPGVEIECS